MMKELAIGLALVSTIVGGTYAVESRYALRTQVATVQVQIYQNRLDQVERRIFEIKLTQERRPLTQLEKQELNRLLRLRDQIIRDMERQS